MGDFTGFSFGDWHSTDPETGVVEVIRVSSGDRYEEQLHPEIKDRTAEVPGVNGEYFFGSDFGTRTFDIEFAFDHLTEVQFRQLRKTFGTKEIKELIFDERPYKYYMAKLESPVELSYVCFDEPKRVVVGTADNDKRYGVRVANRTTTSNTEQVVDEETGETTEVTTYTTTIERERIYPYETREGKERIYKGEGKMTLVCYFPFAKSNFKVLPEQGQAYYEGSEEWAVSSGLLSNAAYTSNYDTYIAPEQPEGSEEPPETPYINVYNPGDVETGFRMYIPFNGWSDGAVTLSYRQNASDTFADVLVINKPTPQRYGGTVNNPLNDIGILIDTNNGLITGVSAASDNSITTTGNLYNKYVEAGHFFKIQPYELDDEATITITNGNGGIKIFYDYLYF